MSEVKYPKRLIEVDLPIRKISEHARREKSIRHGHISTLHLWWARRPLAACRAVVLAALLPDPADEACPKAFRSEAAATLSSLRETIGGSRVSLDDPEQLRAELLLFIAEFANWDLAVSEHHLRAARQLVASAHSALGGHTSAPLVIDPFAGGGAIPLEALRVGASVYASDLNPVAVLLNKVILDQIPKHGITLIEEVQKWGQWMAETAEKELRSVYAAEGGGRQPVAYLWARTIDCEGPACGMRVPLLKSGWIAKRGGRLVAVNLRAIVKERRFEFELETPRSASESRPGTIAGAHVLCPACGFTTKKDRVRAQLRERHGGVDDAQLYCVALASVGGDGRTFRLPTDEERAISKRVHEALKEAAGDVPDEPIPQERVWKNNPIRVHLYGIDRWSKLFTPRQRLLLATYSRLAREAYDKALESTSNTEFAAAVGTILALAVSRLADISNAHCQWSNTSTQVVHLFGRQAISMTWDFAEAAPFTPRVAGNLLTTLGSMCEVLAREARKQGDATVARHSATRHPLPDDSAQVLFTDPPYYDAVPYATLADFFYVWLRRAVPPDLRSLFSDVLIDKTDECVVDEAKGKDRAYFEKTMAAALAEARRVVAPDGIGVIVFAHKSTAGWEAQLKAMIEAGWVVTGSWPIDTERADRMRAHGSAALASSVHLVCRPRERADGSLATNEVGDWRSVLEELPRRIQSWLPRLADEGVVGADAIFACLGPALEIFSQYSSVEKVSGERVELREYLEHVWAAVSREALTMIFEGADTAGLEPDARLTAMWLWTLAASPALAADDESDGPNQVALGADDDGPASVSSGAATGFVLEYDAARKIAQGLGAQLEELEHVAVIDGENARLLPVVERTKHLFGRIEGTPTARKAAKRKQMTLFGDLDQAAETQGWGEVGAPKAGTTTLDRVHQSMLLFGSGRGEALKRFIVEGNVGQQPQFWKLAQSLSALYPTGTDEKRWVDGVLARKKGLGF